MSSYEFWDELGKIFNAVVAYQESEVRYALEELQAGTAPGAIGNLIFPVLALVMLILSLMGSKHQK